MYITIAYSVHIYKHTYKIYQIILYRIRRDYIQSKFHINDHQCLTKKLEEFVIIWNKIKIAKRSFTVQKILTSRVESQVTGR